MTVTNEPDKGCESGDMGDHVTVGLDKRWRYMVTFEDLPRAIRAIDVLGADWILEDAWPLEGRVRIAVDVDLDLIQAGVGVLCGVGVV